MSRAADARPEPTPSTQSVLPPSRAGEPHEFASPDTFGFGAMAALREAGEAAVRAYGAQLGGARLRDGCPLFAELTARLGVLSGGHVLLTPSLALGHMAALPVLIRPGDALVIDAAAHPSLHTAAMLLEGVERETVPYHDARALTSAAQRLARLHRRVWLACDGVDAMHGALAPFALLEALLAALPNLRLYVDDGEATSWAGLQGRGLALTRLAAFCERLVVALSLAGAFGASGGALVLGCAEACAELRSEAEPMLLSGGVHPGMLGSALAAAELHLEPRFALRQAALTTRIDLASALALEAGVPLAAAEGAPIFFVPIGATVPTLEVLQALRRAGYRAGAGVFPAVPLDRAGIRFTVGVLTDPGELASFVEALAGAVGDVGLLRPSDVRALGAGDHGFGSARP